MREKLTVIKVGGKIVEEEATLRQLLNDFAAIEGHKVLVHGGGRSATKIAAQLGIESKMVNGRRITRARAGHGDEIRFDQERFQLVMPGRSLPAQTQAEEAPASRGWAYLVLVAVIVVAVLWGFR